MLVQHCYECHSAQAADDDKLKGGLLVDSRQGLLAGGDSGPAAAPGETDDSLVLEALRYESLEMPPKGKLPDSVIEDFQTWIEIGMPDPRQSRVTAATGVDLESGRKHWAYQPLVQPAIPIEPEVAATGPIDVFIQKRLRRQQLRQVARASRPTLVRRLYFDLIGLPPSPREIDAFVNNDSPTAYADLVDRLLASPRFGERWGRHWLDVARYADSVTLRGLLFPEAWRYRDYVIETFNMDRSLARFIQEQVAGDLMPWSTLEERRRNLTATTFLTLGNTNLEDQDKQKLRMDVVDEQLEVIGRGFLAQTIGCARCHDHKFDPIPTRDYYALAGILRNTKTLEDANVSRWLELPLPMEADKEAAYAVHALAIAELKSEIESVARATQSADVDTGTASSKPADEGTAKPDDKSPHRAELQKLRQQLEQLNENPPIRSMVMSVQEESEVGDAAIHIRGDVHNQGQTVQRGFLQAASFGETPKIPAGQSGRLQLGHWLVSAGNPLPARVMANRIWHWLFGAGLVRTTDNFGVMGELPSHAQLLDYLAVRLLEHNWSAKRLVREIVLSTSYQLASEFDPAEVALEVSVDPENRLLWRTNRRRLDAESILDTMLTVSGQLRYEMGGPMIREGAKTDYDYDHKLVTRRAVYWPVLRNSMPPFSQVFDVADPSMVTGRRNVTSTAPQSLFMMNNPLVVQLAMLAGNELAREPGKSDTERIKRAFRKALGRSPTTEEQLLVADFVQAERGMPSDQSPEEAEAHVWGQVVHGLFGTLDFRYRK